VFGWLEAQLHEHGHQPWAAMREALRGSEHEAFACIQVEQATMGADAEAELSELTDVMNRLRRDGLEEQARQLADRVARGDASAMEDYKRVNAQLLALKSSTPA
jgi:DNA primase